MRELGHADDCMLLVTNEYPDSIAARDGGDTVAALITDLTQIAAVVLREPDERFEAIVRLGFRCYST
jgi:hypothetical protein